MPDWLHATRGRACIGSVRASSGRAAPVGLPTPVGSTPERSRASTCNPSLLARSDKYGLVYVITKLGLLFVYDLETATAVYRTRVSSDPIFLAAPAPDNGGFAAINRYAGDAGRAAARASRPRLLGGRVVRQPAGRSPALHR